MSMCSAGLILMALGMDKKSIKRRKAKEKEALEAKKVDNPAATTTTSSGRMTRSKAKAKAAAAAASDNGGDTAEEGKNKEKESSADKKKKKLKAEVFITFLNLLPYAPFHYLLRPCEPARGRGKEKAL